MHSIRSLSHKQRRLATRPVEFALTIIAMLLSAFAQQSNKALSEMTLEDLMNVEVTSVAKHEQPLSETAAAVFVITQEDIRRSGATNIPEALRLAPPLTNAQSSKPRDAHEGAPTCSECGMLMVPNGACYKCENCGSTSGCS